MKDAKLPDQKLSHRDLPRLRRIALGHQALLRQQPFGRGIGAAARAIDHLGYVQIDTISVVERAHHHVLRSRVPNYAPTMLNRLLKERRIFEHWSHAAAFMPMQDFRFSLPYKALVRANKKHGGRHQDPKLRRQIMGRIKSEGPLRSRDLEDKQHNSQGWWNWKPAKFALEYMFMCGELMITERDGFQKTYDLTERVLPSSVDASMPSYDEFAAFLYAQQLRCHGFVSLKGLTYLRRDEQLRKAMRKLVDTELAEGRLQRWQITDRGTFFAPPELLDKAPRATSQIRILSPFDNAVIQRERLQDLFDFAYQIECYVPGPKRQYGYFSLPILCDTQFLGRMDCKAHRNQRRLTINHLHLEAHGPEQVDPRQLAMAIQEFAAFNNCDTIDLTRTTPAAFAASLQPHLI